MRRLAGIAIQIVAMLCAALAAPARAYDMRILISDGLGRPVPGAKLIILGEARANGKTRLPDNATTFLSGPDGVVHVQYDSAASGRGQVRGVRIIKPGFAWTENSSPPLERYTILRDAKPGAIAAMRRMPVEAVLPALREHLASEWRTRPDSDPAAEIFPDAARFISPLLELVKDPFVGRTSMSVLVEIAGLEERRRLARHLAGVFLSADSSDLDWIADTLAGALYAPDSEEEWQFLHRCGKGEFGRWSMNSARQTLRTMESTRAKALLAELHASSPTSVNDDREAPARLILRPSGPSAEALVRSNLHLIGGGSGTLKGPIRYNKDRSLAWATVTELASHDLFTYRARMERQGDQWVWLGSSVSTIGFLTPEGVAREKKARRLGG